ncbi:DUF4394 domain-containing protein [Ideonella livida]|uniref:DUF4394 domain-containing protein n=1 Tax=Ideonella livida TaxID=2707176 RepID=UPI001EF24C58|nr:DUF4394 domain-containing protein [Ideonella livida]
MTRVSALRSLALAACVLALAGCAATAPGGVGPAREVALAVTASHQLVAFHAAQPQHLLWRRPLQGLQPGETVLGLDHRVKNETFYLLGSSGQLYTLDPDTAVLTPLGRPVGAPLTGRHVGFDFNPVADRLRVVSDAGMNLRLHPDTGEAVDGNAELPGWQPDGPLQAVAGDPLHGRPVSLVAAAYSYNKANPKITTNYVIEAYRGLLMIQGSREGATPVVSPNTGQLRTVGPLLAGPFASAQMDIDILTDQAYAALNPLEGGAPRWVRLDVNTGRATVLGTVGVTEPLLAMALDPQPQ